MRGMTLFQRHIFKESGIICHHEPSSKEDRDLANMLMDEQLFERIKSSTHAVNNILASDCNRHINFNKISSSYVIPTV